MTNEHDELLVRQVRELRDGLFKVSADRDEWKQQHENLLTVKAQDNAALNAKILGLVTELKKIAICPWKGDSGYLQEIARKAIEALDNESI